MTNDLIKALEAFSDAAYDLLVKWDENLPSTANNFSNDANDLICTGYPFDLDFSDVALNAIDWKWAVINRAKEITHE